MAGDALPLVVLVEPGVGKAAVVLGGLTLISSLGVVGADHNSRIAVGNHPGFVIGNQRGVIVRVLQIGQKLRFVHDRAVVVGVNEAVGNQVVQGLGVMMKLRLVPGIFQRDKFAGIGIGVAGRVPSHQQSAQQ